MLNSINKSSNNYQDTTKDYPTEVKIDTKNPSDIQTATKAPKADVSLKQNLAKKKCFSLHFDLLYLCIIIVIITIILMYLSSPYYYAASKKNQNELLSK